MSNTVIGLKHADKKLFSGHLRVGGINCRGETVNATNYYLMMNGRPFYGLCGEFHFSRCPVAYWEEELLKIKAAGLNCVSTYVFWNHHEEEEGIFRWDGEKNLRRFLELCGKHELLVFLRIGPFAHGEARNGGFPDWLYGRPFTVRSNDAGYLAFVERFFQEIGRQVTGLLFKDGGPVAALQLENEHNAASAPWEFLVVNEYEWVHKGSGGADHIRALMNLANKAGMEAPIYTCTGWDNGSYLKDETLPVYGGYCWQPWAVNDGSAHKPSYDCVIRDFHEGVFKSDGFTPASMGGRYPYICSELGGGMACWYKYRFAVAPESVLAATTARVAGGCNFLGYYMFHDGTNPLGKHSYLNERTVPKISYNFQAPIGEYGQIKDSYKLLKPLFYFLGEYGEELCQMATALPDGGDCILPEDCETLRAAARHKDGSGFLFLVNYQDHLELPDRENVRLTLELPDETLSIPSGEGFTLKRGISAVLPFNMDLGGMLLKYATAQLITTIEDGETDTWFFFTPDGMVGEYCLDSSTIGAIEAYEGTISQAGGFTCVSVTPGTGCTVDLTGLDGKRVRICTLTHAQALRTWEFDIWGKKRIMISDADLCMSDGCLEAVQAGNPEIELGIYPEAQRLAMQGVETDGTKDGIFTVFKITQPSWEGHVNVGEAGPGKAIVSVPADALEGLHDVMLRVDYLGSVGNAFMDGRLVADNFCNGQIWEIGLRRFFPEISEEGMYIHVIPYQKGSDVVFEPGLEFRHEFDAEETAKIFSIEAMPVYRALISEI